MDTVRVEAEGRIGRITLARPEKLNALSRQVLEELTEAASAFGEEVSVVIVGGEGRAFSAGFDLADRTWAELGPPERSTAVGRAMTEAIGGMPALTIASIRGHCIGGGMVLASACDLRVASTTASFRLPEVDLGVPLYWTGVPRLVREIGPALTKELVLTGRSVDAAEAKAIRFVNRVVDDAVLDDAVTTLAEELAAKPAHVVFTTKHQVELAAPILGEDLDADLAGLAAAQAVRRASRPRRG